MVQQEQHCMLHQSGMVPMALLNVLIVEDETTVAQRIFEILNEWSRSGHVFRSENVSDALAVIEANPLDILIADLDLPDGNGTVVIERLLDQNPKAEALVLSAISTRSAVLEAIKSGASGYIHKEDDSSGIIEVLEGIQKGHAPISPSLAKYVFTEIQGQHESTSTGNPASHDLTHRELDVLRAIAKGYSYKEIAKLYQISANTVPVHIRNIYKKLNAKNKMEAAIEARHRGIL